MTMLYLVFATVGVHAASPLTTEVPRSAAQIFEAVAQVVHTTRPVHAGAESVRVLGHLTALALKQTADQALQRDLGWSDVRHDPGSADLDENLSVVLRASDIPLTIDHSPTAAAVPDAVAMLETVAMYGPGSAERRAADEALRTVYATLSDLILAGTRDADGPAPRPRLHEVVTQAMAWLEASDHAAAAAALRTVAQTYSSDEGPLVKLAAEHAGNVLVAKAKRTRWFETAMACADVLQQKR